MTLPRFDRLVVVSASVTALTVLTLIGGCASTPRDEQVAAADAPVCKRVYPIGSNLPVTTCMTAEQAAENKRDLDIFQQRGSGAARAPGGGN